MVVEDDPILLMHSSALIEDAGFDVIEARNADEAIALLEKQPDVHIVFTDIEMPGSMDGLKLARAVRDRWPPVHLIIASGRYRPGAHELPEDSRFFAKPFDSEELVATLNHMAAHPRL